MSKWRWPRVDQLVAIGCALAAIHIARGLWDFGWWMIPTWLLMSFALSFAQLDGRKRQREEQG